LPIAVSRYRGAGGPIDAGPRWLGCRKLDRGRRAACYEAASTRGDRKAALDWLEKAIRLRDPGLVYTKVDPLMDPLRKEPRFQAVTQELQFPQ
jgi:hypothetical protein